MSLRIRQVKPAFWTDSALADWSDELRLFYIGMWMSADDGGWMRWDPVQVGVELFGFLDRRKREAKVDRCRKALEESGRMRIEPCGHAFIPHLVDHQRFSGEQNRVLTFTREHAGKCLGEPQEPPPPPKVVAPRPTPQRPAPAPTPPRADGPRRLAEIIGPLDQIISGKH